jgi:hypothetical protein
MPSTVPALQNTFNSFLLVGKRVRFLFFRGSCLQPPKSKSHFPSFSFHPKYGPRSPASTFSTPPYFLSSFPITTFSLFLVHFPFHFLTHPHPPPLPLIPPTSLPELQPVTELNPLEAFEPDFLLALSLASSVATSPKSHTPHSNSPQSNNTQPQLQ